VNSSASASAARVRHLQERPSSINSVHTAASVCGHEEKTAPSSRGVGGAKPVPLHIKPGVKDNHLAGQ